MLLGTIMNILTKHGKIFVKIKHDQTSNKFVLLAKNGYDNIGRLEFCVEKHLDRCWLNSVKTSDDFGHRGVGTALLTAMEFVVLKMFGIRDIVGIYNPFNDYAYACYIKNGYVVDEQNSKVSKKNEASIDDYFEKIDCGYAELMKCKIDFEKLEEMQK